MNRALLCLTLAAALSAPIGRAQQKTFTRLDGTKITHAEIDATVARLMNAAEVTGAGIALLNRGEIAYQKAYGFRDKERNLPLTVDTNMSAASLSKVAFAYMVMTLVEEGALDLDRPIVQYLPNPLPSYPNYADLASDARYNLITSRMLLSHTSGFPNWRWFEEDRKLKIHFAPGSRYAYSGEGIALLQFVVETITKKPLSELMGKRVFQPLQMSRTSMVWKDRPESEFANGYDEYGRSLGPQKREKAEAAGSMQTTPADFAKFFRAVMLGKGLRSQTWQQMLSPQIAIHSKHQFPTFSSETTKDNNPIRLSYGLAWGLYSTPYGRAFFKEGHDEGWRNYAVGFDKQKTGIIIMTNSSNGEGIFKELLETLLRNTFTPIEWEGYTPYDKLPPRPPLKQHTRVSIAPALLDRYPGRYLVPPNLILTVRRQGDHLSLQESDEPPQDLLPESDVDFFSTASEDTCTFQLDAYGKLTAIILHVDGRDIAATRFE